MRFGEPPILIALKRSVSGETYVEDVLEPFKAEVERRHGQGFMKSNMFWFQQDGLDQPF